MAVTVTCRAHVYRQAVGVLVLVGLLSACSTVREAARVEMPVVTVIGAQVVGVSTEEVRVDLTLAVTNPNRFVINKISTDLDISVGEQPLLKVDNAHFDTAIPAQGNANITVPLAFQFAKVLALMPQVMANNSLEYSVRGHIVVSLPILGSVRIPVTHQGVIPIPKPPTVSLASLALGSLSLTHVSLDLVVDVYNPNRFGIKAMDGDYRVALNQTVVGNITVHTGALRGEQAGQVRVSLNVSPLAIGLETLQAVRWHVELAGKTRWVPDVQGAEIQIDDLLVGFDWLR